MAERVATPNDGDGGGAAAGGGARVSTDAGRVVCSEPDETAVAWPDAYTHTNTEGQCTHTS